jgi:hypothetical protein
MPTKWFPARLLAEYARGVPALLPAQDRIVLIARLETELKDGDEFEMRVAALTVAAADWRRRLAEAARTGPGQGTTFIVP